VPYPATSPNLLAAYIRILPGESLETQARATSQAFYVIRGSGVSTSTEHGEIKWNKGDLFVLPAAAAPVSHAALGVEAAEGGEAAALYWVSDEPLLRYLGVSPSEKKFEPTLYTRERMVASVELLKHEEGVEHRNRLGILLGNKVTEKSTLTLTHTLWSLLNLLPAGQKQRPHR
jgi:gentisate 1,2-dioxygenase